LISEKDIERFNEFDDNYNRFLKERQEFDSYKEIQIKDLEAQRQKIDKTESDTKLKEHNLQRQQTDIEIQKQKLKMQSETIQKAAKQLEEREIKLAELEGKISINLTAEELKQKYEEKERKLVEKYEEKERKLEEKYAEMEKEMMIREREREIEYNTRIQEFEDKYLKNLDHKDQIITKHRTEICELNKKIKKTCELVKTVMNLSKEDFTNFEQTGNHKSHKDKNFSFDLNKVVKQLNNDSVNNELSSEEKDKIIIKEPLEVFEIDNMGKVSEIESDDKSSHKNNTSNDNDDSDILKNYHNGNFILNDSNLNEYEDNDLVYSPKFMSIK